MQFSSLSLTVMFFVINVGSCQKNNYLRVRKEVTCT